MALKTLQDKAEALAAEYLERVRMHDELTGACADLRRERAKDIRDLHEATANTLTALFACAEATEAREQALLMAQTALINDTVLMGMARDEAMAERDAALAEVARLSTPPDDAEVAELVERLRDTAEIHDEAGEYDRVMSEELAKEAREAADALTSLSHAHAAETVKREAMEEALRYYNDQFCEGFCDDMPSLEYTDADCERDCGGCKARATLAKHGSKT